jgi:hypothetical protein
MKYEGTYQKLGYTVSKKEMFYWLRHEGINGKELIVPLGIRGNFST